MASQFGGVERAVEEPIAGTSQFGGVERVAEEPEAPKKDPQANAGIDFKEELQQYMDGTIDDEIKPYVEELINRGELQLPEEDFIKPMS